YQCIYCPLEAARGQLAAGPNEISNASRQRLPRIWKSVATHPKDVLRQPGNRANFVEALRQRDPGPSPVVAAEELAERRCRKNEVGIRRMRSKKINRTFD